MRVANKIQMFSQNLNIMFLKIQRVKLFILLRKITPFQLWNQTPERNHSIPSNTHSQTQERNQPIPVEWKYEIPFHLVLEPNTPSMSPIQMCCSLCITKNSRRLSRNESSKHNRSQWKQKGHSNVLPL